MKKPLVSIVIVHYNGFDVLRDCLESIKKLEYKNFEVIVVDNASTDDSLKKLANYTFSKVSIITSPKNLGFAGGNNLALKQAKGVYLLLLNNDTKVQPDLLTVMVAKMERDESIGAMQPKIKLMDKPGYLDNAGAFLNRLGLSVHWGFGERDGKEYDQEKEIFSAKGACLMTRLKIVQKVGLFDETFGSYFEESDFCFRIWLAGYRVLYYPETYILHKVGYTSSKMDPVSITLHSTKNRISSLAKNFNVIHIITILIPHILFLLMLGLYYLLKLQFNKFHMIYGAIWWNICNIPSLLKKRRSVQLLRKKKDSEIFPIIFKPIDLPLLLRHFKKVEENFRSVN